MSSSLEWLDYMRAEARCNEGDFRKTPGAESWRAFDGMAVGLEDVEFLFALARILKPSLILEGSAGRSTVAFAAACRDNGFGLVVSCESMEIYADAAQFRLENLSLDSHAHIIHSPDGTLSYQGSEPEMIFLDSDAPIRAKEISRWMDHPAHLIIHDSRGSHATPQMPTGGQDFDTPRGLWVRLGETERFPRC